MLQKIRKHLGDASLCGITRTGSKGMSHFAFSIFAKTPSEGRKVLESRSKGKPECLYNPLSGAEVLVILRPVI
jgi:hypothetical protein